VQLDRNDLRRTAEFAQAAVAARSAADVDALVHRLRRAIRCDVVHLQRIAAGAVAEWRDPDDGGREKHTVADHDGRRLTVSEPTSFGLVHLTAWRRRGAFRAQDHALLSLMSPYLIAAVATVDGAHHGSGADQHAPAADGALTSREVQILALIAEGATNKEVASDLHISPRTVQKHLEHIYDKLGLHRRTAAAGWWSEHLAAG
jgi:DNA-binding CsgD family transcriptional regulator